MGVLNRGCQMAGFFFRPVTQNHLGIEINPTSGTSHHLTWKSETKLICTEIPLVEVFYEIHMGSFQHLKSTWEVYGIWDPPGICCIWDPPGKLVEPEIHPGNSDPPGKFAAPKIHPGIWDPLGTEDFDDPHLGSPLHPISESVSCDVFKSPQIRLYLESQVDLRAISFPV